MKLIPADDMKDKLWGKKGTPEREAMETRLPYARLDWHKNLTQEELGERIGYNALKSRS